MDLAAVGRGNACPKLVFPYRCDIKRVLHPLGGHRPADVKAAAGVLRCLDVHCFSATISAPFVGGIGIVIGNTFTALIKVFGLDGVVDVEWSSFEGAAGKI